MGRAGGDRTSPEEGNCTVLFSKTFLLVWEQFTGWTQVSSPRFCFRRDK
jgi:hypothetical protein